MERLWWIFACRQRDYHIPSVSGDLQSQPQLFLAHPGSEWSDHCCPFWTALLDSKWRFFLQPGGLLGGRSCLLPFLITIFAVFIQKKENDDSSLLGHKLMGLGRFQYEGIYAILICVRSWKMDLISILHPWVSMEEMVIFVAVILRPLCSPQIIKCLFSLFLMVVMEGKDLRSNMRQRV